MTVGSGQLESSAMAASELLRTRAGHRARERGCGETHSDSNRLGCSPMAAATPVVTARWGLRSILPVPATSTPEGDCPNSGLRSREVAVFLVAGRLRHQGHDTSRSQVRCRIVRLRDAAA